MSDGSVLASVSSHVPRRETPTLEKRAREMGQPRSSGEWAKAIADELKFKRVASAPALTAFRLATVINWSPKEPERQGRPALYWRNKTAAAYLGIEWRTFERHRSDLRKAGLIGMDRDGNLVPLLTVKTDAVRVDAVKTVGPYEVDLFKEDLSRSSFEVEGVTVNTDGAPAETSVGSQVPWPRVSSPTGSTTPGSATGETFAPPPHWGRGGPALIPGGG